MISRSLSSAKCGSLRVSITAALAAVVVPLLIAALPPALHAATITVNTIGDPGPAGTCDLHDAITNADHEDQSGSTSCAAGTGVDTIVFSVSGTITLTFTLPLITNAPGGSLTIDGTGQSITVDGNNTRKVFAVNPGATLNLNDLTIAHGNASVNKFGAVLNQGTLNVTNCTFSDNSGAIAGGAIFNEGTLTVNNCLFENNNTTQVAGAVFNAGPATITNCTFSDNGTGGDGGGAILFEGRGGGLTISNSLFTGNTSTGKGGAIEAMVGNLTVTNSTFAGNTSTGRGGAIHNEDTLTVLNCTFSGNTSDASAGGVIYNTSAGQATVSNTILADNSSTDNCDGGNTPPVTDGGYNISDDTTCDFTGTGVNGKPIGDNVSDANIALGLLADNGGFTDTFALEAGSYAIDAIPISRCPATDQRGAPRPDPGSGLHAPCDVGAFESGNLVWITPTSLSFGNVAVTQRSVAATVMLNNQSGQNLNIRSWSIGADYTIVSSTCPSPPSVLPSGESCTFEIAFRPIYTGVRNETFQVNDNLGGGKQIVTLRGIGVSLPALRAMR